MLVPVAVVSFFKRLSFGGRVASSALGGRTSQPQSLKMPFESQKEHLSEKMNAIYGAKILELDKSAKEMRNTCNRLSQFSRRG